MRKIFLFIFILLLAGLVLIGGSCGRDENGEKLPSEEEQAGVLPSYLVYPNSTLGSKDVVSSEELGGTPGATVVDAVYWSLDSPSSVVEWYKKQLSEHGYTVYAEHVIEEGMFSAIKEKEGSTIGVTMLIFHNIPAQKTKIEILYSYPK